MKNAELFDDYLQNQLSSQQRQDFEAELANNPALENAFNQHRQLVDVLGASERRASLKQQLKAIHQQEIGQEARVIAMQNQPKMGYGKTVFVAAATAFIAVLSTILLLSTGGYLLTNQSQQMKELGKTLNDVKATTDGIVLGITQSKKTAVYAQANMQGSAFALNNNGYVITSYHMVKGADSIFIQNQNTERSLARLVHSNPALDIAILKVENTNITRTWQVPFSIKEKNAEVGEKVFTIGYPREDMVYGEGSLSSRSGYSNDSSMYQISIPVNPGNSGGPLLDEQGNIIGVIRGKITGAEATGFAVKAAEILHVIDSAPDSTKTRLSLAKNRKYALKHLKRTEQIRRINPYVFNVLIYNKE